jgi:hypothetical protein
MQVITYQVGIGFDFQPLYYTHILDDEDKVTYYTRQFNPLKRKITRKRITRKII